MEDTKFRKIDVGFHGRCKGNEGGLLKKALEGSTIHTQDYNEPLNTRRRGGEFMYKYRVACARRAHDSLMQEERRGERGGRCRRDLPQQRGLVPHAHRPTEGEEGLELTQTLSLTTVHPRAHGSVKARLIGC